MNEADKKWLYLAEAIDEAVYVRAVRLGFEDNDIEDIIGVLIWYGGHTVRFINSELGEDVYNIGDFSKDEVPFEVAQEKIEEIADSMINSYWNEFYSE